MTLTSPCQCVYPFLCSLSPYLQFPSLLQSFLCTSLQLTESPVYFTLDISRRTETVNPPRTTVDGLFKTTIVGLSPSNFSPLPLSLTLFLNSIIPIKVKVQNRHVPSALCTQRFSRAITLPTIERQSPLWFSFQIFPVFPLFPSVEGPLSLPTGPVIIS